MTSITLDLEEQEVLLRKERAQNEPLKIKILNEAYFPFTDYEVTGATNVHYFVEVRSLGEKINACSCPDFHVNTLGMCKHIEGVLHFIKKRGKKVETQLIRTEIFLDLKTQEVCVRYPDSSESMKSLIDPYFSAAQVLLSDPLNGLSSLEKTLSDTLGEIASKVRISNYLKSWVSERQLAMSCETDKRLFLSDVQAGKRSLQMLSCKLFPYQEEGMLHLAFKGRAILADEMGLGKTIQAIAAAELLHRLGRVKRVLVVTPASLKGEWEEQIARFSGLPTLMVNGSRAERLACYKKESFFYLVNYEQVRSDHEELQVLLNPDVIILDEAQRVKNWQTKTAWAVKRIKTPYAFVLTGTPIENRIEELYSIMQVVNPKVLGPLFKFQQDFYAFNEKGKAVKHKNLGNLNKLLEPVLLRRRKKEVEEHLPERTQKNYFVGMTPEQTVRYDEYSAKVSRLLHILKRRPLTLEESKRLQQFLACMRMVADTPYILDEECRDSPKLEELEEILKSVMENNDVKVIIFSEWERMLFLVRDLADKLNLNYAWHTGSVPQQKRRDDIKRFKEDPKCKLFLTTDSGSTGLNLQVASVVINVDLPWNPAKLEQRIARAWRKNQTRQVQVINLVTENTIEHRMLSTLAMKQAVADAVLDGMGDLDDMPLAGGSREDFVARLEGLINQNVNQPQETATLHEDSMSAESFKQDLLARHNDRIHLVEEHPQMVLIVADKIDAALKESFSRAPKAVEVLDLETYLTLQRLASQGIIQLDSSGQLPLYESSLIQNGKRDQRKQKLDEAAVCMKEAQRKLKMSLLLKSGEFLEEALLPAQESFKRGWEVLNKLELPPNDMALRLKAEHEHIENGQEFIDSLAQWIGEVAEQLIQYTLGIGCFTHL